MSRLENATSILRYAIENNVSAHKASILKGHSNSYVKNAKISANERFESGTLSEDKYNNFMSVVREYENRSTTTGKKDSYQSSMDNRVIGPDESIKEPQTKWTETDEGAELDYRGDRVVKSLDELLKQANVDTKIWKVDKKVVNKWDVSMKQGNGNAGSVMKSQNWQVKAWLSKRKEAVELLNISEEFKKLIEGFEPKSTKPKHPFNGLSGREKNLLEVSLFDLHLGKLCWAGETGENYDVKIASKRFNSALDKLLYRAGGFEYERILFPIGNDFFNSDNIFNTTTAGTPQDEDLRWQKTFMVGIQLLIEGIERLKQQAPVDILLIPGNHDFERTIYLGVALFCWFKNDTNVKFIQETQLHEDQLIELNVSPRQYYRYGQTLLGFTHGSEEKEASLPMIMATERKEDWGQTKYHEFHLGHIHRRRTTQYLITKGNRVMEENGVTIRYMSSLSGTEEWHNKKGFVNNVKAAEAILWNSDNGYIGSFNVNLENYWDE